MKICLTMLLSSPCARIALCLLVCCVVTVLSASAPTAFAPSQKIDFCIYGATSSGVIAAVSAARQGLNVLIVEPLQRHIGGMTASGLGWTDFGDAAMIGGITHELYVNIGKHYRGMNNTTPVYYFAPQVAEAAFNNLTTAAIAGRIHVVYEAGDTVRAFIDEQSRRISHIQVSDSAGIAPPMNFSARVFLDASYEGDLMAAVPSLDFTFGRESRAQYNESFAGTQLPTGITVDVDPFVQEGNVSSGLIQGIDAMSVAPLGSADQLLQAYNYRLCLTFNANNRVPIAKPDKYDPAQFELHARWIRASNITALNSLLKLSIVPNDKTDTNNAYDVSTDFIGANNFPYNYVTANVSTRQLIRVQHREYTRGFLWFLGNDERVPATLRRQMSSWGWCKDEFVDNDNFPWQFYVREARRMVGTYVVTERDVFGPYVSDGIAVATYELDCHAIQRVAVFNAASQKWRVHNEGGPTGNLHPKPWPISFRALVPKSAQCTNLLVTTCLSASHVSYMSIRMEPVYMQLGQAAATAAVLAIQQSADIQDVNVDQLRSVLRSQGQIIDPPKMQAE